MDGIAHRLDCFDEDGKKVAIDYLNKCLTKFLKSNVKKQRKFLKESGANDDQINDLCTLRMLGLGLITREDAKKLIRNTSVRVN